jgi:histidinol-phosphate phosphatase family protein
MNFDKSWTLFLDRDGVINHKRENDYVKKWEEFIFLPGALQAMEKLAKVFGHIFIVTNQQGIGKKIYTEAELAEVHSIMMEQVEKAGGRVDRIYFAPGLAKDDPPTRKPNPGMALQAKKDFPAVDLSRSVMIGDSMSDMEMGRRAGMYNVFITSSPKDSPLIDECSPSLSEFAAKL